MKVIKRIQTFVENWLHVKPQIISLNLRSEGIKKKEKKVLSVIRKFDAIGVKPRKKAWK